MVNIKYTETLPGPFPNFLGRPGDEARCLTCEFANLLPCVILIAAEDWKKNQCICYCVDCSNRLHEGKSHHEILPVVSAVFVMWGVKPEQVISFLNCSAKLIGLWYKLIRM